MKMASILAIVAVATTATANAERVQIEAEDFTASHDILFEPIRKLDAPDCSGGYMLVGLDCADEWTEYDLTISSLGTWVATMKCRGDYLLTYTFRLTFTANRSGDNFSIDMTYVGQAYG